MIMQDSSSAGKIFPSQQLKSWFHKEKRSLPWRENPTGYRVLVSEMMLQQTQATTVEPYFIRWMEQFKTIEALAEAEEAHVLKAWEGLGYYSRARNLQKAARYILEFYNGAIPTEVKELEKLPGIGPYTAAAIAAFAFKKKAIAIDGNVLRVASRLYDVEEPVNTPKGLNIIKEKLSFLLQDEEPWVISEALIELGATICNKKPQCHKCPLREICLARFKGKADSLPIKKKAAETTFLEREVMIACWEDELLLCLRSKKGLMHGLYEFPYFDKNAENSFKDFLKNPYFLKKELPTLIQSFTRFRVTLYPFVCRFLEKEEVADHIWVKLDQAKLLPFSSAHKKILAQLINIE